MIGRALKAYIGTYRRHVAFVLATVALTSVFTAVNSASSISDYARVGQPIAWGKPVMFEATSAIAILIMLPFIIRVGEVWPLRRSLWLPLIPRYVLASFVFSAGHVLLMVAMRKLMYGPLFGGSYDFFRGGYGAIPYEYWKDLRTFVLLTGAFFLLWDAMAGRAAKKAMAPVELRSGATRILLDPAEFLYAKAAANYAEIITLSGESLARITLKELEEKLKEGGVQAVRVHRSMLVNRVMIQTIDPLPGGDMKLALKGGHTLRASRRYKAGLDQ